MDAPNHSAERNLSVLVVLEAIQLFVVAPLSAEPGVRVPAWSFFVILAANVAVVLAVVWRRPVAVAAVSLAALTEVAAVLLRLLRPSANSATLDLAAVLLLLVALTVVLSLTVFGPGRVTVHRIVGAIAIYLNVATVFAMAYRTIASLSQGAFGMPAGTAPGHGLSTFIYFSFVTLTTTGYGDIIPVDPLARSLCNVEAIFGQLFPATLLARLITLELEHRREARG
jgi:hypothetical protein